MPITGNFVMSASMDVTPEAETVFNQVYNQEHIPMLRSVPGVLSVVRFERAELRMSIGGEVIAAQAGESPQNTAPYELDSPDVLASAEWAEAIEQGRWPMDVRPHTFNRRHVLWRRLTS